MTITETIDRFSKTDISSGCAEASLGIEQNPPNFKMFEREDWTLFRTVEGLQQKAGVPANLPRRLVLKELGDNALDVSPVIRVGRIGDRFFIEDDGPGLDGTPEEIASFLVSVAQCDRASSCDCHNAALSVMACALWRPPS